jgi:glycosyltransferase involved in cell wall biosynthesis
MSPLISIITTFFNAESTIERMLQSMLDQTFTNWEHILVDDGSTDASIEMVNRSTDPRIRVFQPGRVGRAEALNFAIDRARGEFLAILDADDFSLKTRLEIQLREFKDKPDIHVLFGNANLVDDASSILGKTNVKTDHKAFTEDLALMIAPPHSSVMYRKTLLESGIRYNEKCPKSIDYNFYLDCLSAGLKFLGHEEPLVSIRYATDSWGKADANTMQLRFAVLGLLNLYRSRADLPTFFEFNDDKWARFLEAYHEWFDTKPYAREMASRSAAQSLRTRRKEMNLIDIASYLIEIAKNKPSILLNRKRPISFDYSRDAKNASAYFSNRGF